MPGMGSGSGGGGCVAPQSIAVSAAHLVALALACFRSQNEIPSSPIAFALSLKAVIWAGDEHQPASQYAAPTGTKGSGLSAISSRCEAASCVAAAPAEIVPAQ